MKDIYWIIVVNLVNFGAFVLFLAFYRITNRTKKQRVWTSTNNLNDQFEVLVEEIIKAVSFFHEKRIGCLIVFQGKTPLDQLITNEGIAIQGQLSAELIQCVFACKDVQLHDGAILINQDWKIESCSVFFRVDRISKLQRMRTKKHGMRHLVAQQIVFKSDASVIVVSETNGQVSYIYDRKLFFENIKIPILRRKLKDKIREFRSKLHENNH